MTIIGVDQRAGKQAGISPMDVLQYYRETSPEEFL